MRVSFAPMRPADVPEMRIQKSQTRELGLHQPVRTLADGEELAARGPAWTARADGRIVVIAGFAELFSTHALAWAMLADGMGAAHLAVTRFARERIAEAGYRRLDALVVARSVQACKWAMMVGLKPAHVLRCYGGDAEDHILFERIR